MAAKIWLLAAFQLILAGCCSSNSNTTYNKAVDGPEEEWEYEPRIWSAEDSLPDGNSLDEENGPSNNFEAEENGMIEFEAKPIRGKDQTGSVFHKISPEANLRQQDNNDYDFDSDQPETSSREPQKMPVQECTQFRVDTREAVVCDKSRCDKLDFNWPTHDNHIVVIETTKHGMRFHQSDYTFQQRSRSYLNLVQSESKIKFDLLDLFKPSPTTTTTTFTTSAITTPTATTTSAATTTQPETSSPSTQPTSTASPTITTFVPYFSTVSSTLPTSNIDTSQDSNQTQLVTTFRLDTRRTKQKMIGFGGALTDSTCRNIKSLSPEMARSLMEDYYGDRGIRYNLARVSMGSSDFSTTPYTNNDRDNPQTSQKLFQADTKDDVEMRNFRLVDEDYQYKLPTIRQAIATSRNRELKFLSSLWSPPIWMKNNSHIVHGFLKGDVYGPYYKALADYMLKWLEAYRRNGVEFWAITGLNEPVTGVKPFIFHNSLGITKADYITFLKLYLGPMLQQRGFQKTKLMILDDNKGYAPTWVKETLEDSEVSKYISGVAIHWYMNDEYENLNFLQKNHPDKFILSTEACNGFLPFQVHAMPGDWNRGVAYMYDIIKMIQKNSAGWVDWNMALDLSGGPSWANNNLDAAVIVNSARDEYYKSPMFYAMGHFSRFVEPDSMRLDYIMANARFDYPLEAVAFYTPKEYIVIVALNSNKHPVPFKIILNKQLIKIITLKADSFSTIVFKWSKGS